jgi:hypothetical protein
MKFINRILAAPILAPLLFSIYPVLALWVTNYDKVRGNDVVFPFTFFILCFVLIYAVLWAVLRNAPKAALCVMFLQILFFSYGHIYNLIDNKVLFGLLIGRHRFLATFWVILLVLGVVWILRSGQKVVQLQVWVNRIAALLLLATLLQLGLAQIRINTLKSQNNQAGLQSLKPVDAANTPDVYYIILDSYTRDDILSQEFSFDNPLTKQLKSMGFIIPDCAESNYSQTILSMGATLNMGYLKDYASELDLHANTLDYAGLRKHISNNLVSRYFKSLGYKFVTFENDYIWIDIPDSDVYIRPNRTKDVLRAILADTEFEELFSQTTFLRTLEDAQLISPELKAWVDTQNENWNALKKKITQEERGWYRVNYDRTLFTLNNFEQVTRLPGKKFVYLHIIPPHYPFVFGPEGQYLYLPQKESEKGYLNQLKFVNSRVPELIKTILSNSKTPPVIIIQGDHGWLKVPQDRMKILNAYYLPDGGDKEVYATISPVNSFRLIFDRYFGGDFKMLPDKSYFSEQGYKLEEIPSTCAK